MEQNACQIIDKIRVHLGETETIEFLTRLCDEYGIPYNSRRNPFLVIPDEYADEVTNKLVNKLVGLEVDGCSPYIV